VATALRFTVHEIDGLILGIVFALDDAATAAVRPLLEGLASRLAA
jgi:hypothetical protein